MLLNCSQNFENQFIAMKKKFCFKFRILAKKTRIQNNRQELFCTKKLNVKFSKKVLNKLILGHSSSRAKKKSEFGKLKVNGLHGDHR